MQGTSLIILWQGEMEGVHLTQGVFVSIIIVIYLCTYMESASEGDSWSLLYLIYQIIEAAHSWGYYNKWDKLYFFLQKKHFHLHSSQNPPRVKVALNHKIQEHPRFIINLVKSWSHWITNSHFSFSLHALHINICAYKVRNITNPEIPKLGNANQCVVSIQSFNTFLSMYYMITFFLRII